MTYIYVTGNIKSTSDSLTMNKCEYTMSRIDLNGKCLVAYIECIVITVLVCFSQTNENCGLNN